MPLVFTRLALALPQAIGAEPVLVEQCKEMVHQYLPQASSQGQQRRPCLEGAEEQPRPCLPARPAALAAAPMAEGSGLSHVPLMLGVLFRDKKGQCTPCSSFSWGEKSPCRHARAQNVTARAAPHPDLPVLQHSPSLLSPVLLPADHQDHQ